MTREQRTCQNPDCGQIFLFSGQGKGLYCSRACANRATRRRRARRGKDSPNFKGGHIDKDGYRQIYVDMPDGSRKLRPEHRVVMETKLGGPLLPDETVKHIDGNRLNNDPDNLELWTARHPKGRRVEDLLAFADEIVELYGHLRGKL